MDRQECLYDVEWQVLRVSLLGKSGTVEWEGTLWHYMGEMPSAQRVYRVLNLCNATLLAYGNKPGLDHERVVVKRLQEWCQAHGPYDEVLAWEQPWSWHKVLRDLYELYDNDIKAFWAVRLNLARRVKTAQYKARQRGDKDNESGLKHRPYLDQFLQLMDQVEEEANEADQ